MMVMLHELHELYITQRKQNYLIVEGDAKLYEILQSLKHEYGEDLYLAGAFEGDKIDTAWFVHGQNRPQPDPAFFCVAEETNTIIWLHVKQTSSSDILIISPDTDVYHIGCTLRSTENINV